MITAKGVTKTYIGDPIIENAEFIIGNRRKIGVVGKNGCGKTTLFKLITGIETPDSGNIVLEKEVLGYIPQEFSFPDILVGEYLESILASRQDYYKVETLASKLEFRNFDIYQEIKTLSEGQKMKLKMMEVLLTDPTTLFIDEPTNHLDIEGILWFENYIKNLDKSVVMISHDRSFLNNVVDEIWEIENKKIYRFVGDYDNYKIEKNKLIEGWDREYKLFLQHKQKLEQLIVSARKIQDGKARGRAVEAAKKRYDREIEQNKKEKYESKRMRDVDFDTDLRKSKLVVKFKDIAKNYGTTKVFEDLSFEIRGKAKVWLFGPNGAGKTTIVKIIMGEEKPDYGNLTIGPNLKVGYFAQKQTHLNYEKNILDHFMEETHCPYGKVFKVLEKFLFDKDSLQKRVSMLSPGERARFAFAIFAYKDYDFLILDEPTNHLDIETKEVIERSLRDFSGTLLLVSHDRYFVEQVGMDKVLNLVDGTLS